MLTMAKYVLSSFCTHPFHKIAKNTVVAMGALSQSGCVPGCSTGSSKFAREQVDMSTCMHVRSTYEVFQFLGNHLECMQTLSDTFQSILEDAICAHRTTVHLQATTPPSATMHRTGEHTIICSVYIASYLTSFSVA